MEVIPGCSKHPRMGIRQEGSLVIRLVVAAGFGIGEQGFEGVGFCAAGSGGATASPSIAPSPNARASRTVLESSSTASAVVLNFKSPGAIAAVTLGGFRFHLKTPGPILR